MRTLSNLHKYIYLFRDAGPAYFLRRAQHSFSVKSGLLKKKNLFPASSIFPVSLSDFRNSKAQFLFSPDSIHKIPKEPNRILSDKIDVLVSGNYTYFHHRTLPLPRTAVWHTHPLDGYCYPQHLHWTQISDFHPERDIKWMWERSRFCHIGDIIRYDHHCTADSSGFVINEILDWIANNPLHYGPHYISAQEIAIRVLNWLIALHFYKDHPFLTERRWQTILCSIADQVRCIETNIAFSKNLVRNNHLVTEACALFVFGTLFPYNAEQNKRAQKGWQILNEEAEYQFMADGAYLQYSMWYHRVVMQVYQYATGIALKNGITIPDKMREVLIKSLNFLFQHTDPETGEVPNYGANDGSVFFRWHDAPYADFRPLIESFGLMLQTNFDFATTSPSAQNNWIDINASATTTIQQNTNNAFRIGGYYTSRNKRSFIFIRHGKHLFRPSQADQLHIDIRLDGKPLFMDAGTLTYNGNPLSIHNYFGTQAHNTVTIGAYDQMLKGPRFIWFYWSKADTTKWDLQNKYIDFEGSIQGFRESGRWIQHTRKLRIHPQNAEWEITDTVANHKELPIHQHWHITEEQLTRVEITATDSHGNPLEAAITACTYAPVYGMEVPAVRITFTTHTHSIHTHIVAR